MHVENILWQHSQGWQQSEGGSIKQDITAQLIIYFGSQGLLDSGERFEELLHYFPNAEIVGCSTGGEIIDDEVLDDSIVASAISFDKSKIKTLQLSVADYANSTDIGTAIATQLTEDTTQDALRYVFVLSDGLQVNGSDLVTGLSNQLPEEVMITGGLAGDAADFNRTLVGLNTTPKTGFVVAIGFYGEALPTSFGSLGGWDSFGPERVITKSEGSVLYELDGKPALQLYKEYLGEEAANLPSSALLFPLTIRRTEESKQDIVRTIVGVNEEQQSLIFAGDVPQGHIAQLMRGHFDHLIEGAGNAAMQAKQEHKGQSLALLVSCIGRKLLLGQRISDETEAIADILGNNVKRIGFYSYGEICPHGFTGECSLHNQTMTISVLSEAA